MVVTFFVSENPEVTARYLDDRRLGKQRVEAKQIISALIGESTAYSNHPATHMWSGYVEALAHYYNTMVIEWVRRGKQNTMPLYDLQRVPEYPSWCTNEKVHFSHQARLIEKNPEFYTKLFSPPETYLRLGYIWPSKYTTQELISLSPEELCEPFTQVTICSATTRSNTRCTNAAHYDGKCGIHKDKDYQALTCDSICANGQPCKNKAKQTGKCGIHGKKTP
jgi:hypothetical protein